MGRLDREGLLLQTMQSIVLGISAIFEEDAADASTARDGGGCGKQMILGWGWMGMRLLALI